ncbi:helix-turn-helix domain-containing protein [bacterium]|nr:helix-turn-helix domain-containing protein [bacterium]
MNEKYHHLCAEDRKVIYNMNQADFGQAEIAQAIGFSQPTISKELRRNKGKRGYRHKQAGELAKARQQQKARAKVITGGSERCSCLWRFVGSFFGFPSPRALNSALRPRRLLLLILV